MSDPTPFHVVLMYFVGIAMGVMLTLWWQAYAAKIRRQLWDNLSRIYDENR